MRKLVVVTIIALTNLGNVGAAEAAFRRVGAADCKVISGQSVTISDNSITDSYLPAAGSGANHLVWSDASIHPEVANTQIICPVLSDSTIATNQITGTWSDSIPTTIGDGSTWGHYGGLIFKGCTLAFDGSSASCSGSVVISGPNSYLAPPGCSPPPGTGIMSGYVADNRSASWTGWAGHPYDYPYIFVAMGNAPGMSGCGFVQRFMGYGVYF